MACRHGEITSTTGRPGVRLALRRGERCLTYVPAIRIATHGVWRVCCCSSCSPFSPTSTSWRGGCSSAAGDSIRSILGRSRSGRLTFCGWSCRLACPLQLYRWGSSTTGVPRPTNGHAYGANLLVAKDGPTGAAMAPCMMSRDELVADSAWHPLRGRGAGSPRAYRSTRVVASEIRAIWEEREADPGGFEGGR